MSQAPIYEDVIVRLNEARAPTSFNWRGKVFLIDGIDRVWRAPKGEPQGRRMYRVRSRRQSYLLVHDRQNNHWRLVRSPWRLRLSMALNRFTSHLVA